jgi:hypothetical protein
VARFGLGHVRLGRQEDLRVPWGDSYGTSHRDWKRLGISGTESDTATCCTGRDLNTESYFTMWISSRNAIPLVPVPEINSTLDVFVECDTISFVCTTDEFPSHAVRVVQTEASSSRPRSYLTLPRSTAPTLRRSSWAWPRSRTKVILTSRFPKISPLASQSYSRRPQYLREPWSHSGRCTHVVVSQGVNRQAADEREDAATRHIVIAHKASMPSRAT